MRVVQACQDLRSETMRTRTLGRRSGEGFRSRRPCISVLSRLTRDIAAQDSVDQRVQGKV